MANTTTVPIKPPKRLPPSKWTFVLFDRLPLNFSWTIILAGAIAGSEQVLELFIQDPTFSHVTPPLIGKRLVLPLLAIYMLVMLKALKNRTVETLLKLRPVVQVSDENYEGYAYRMVHTDGAVQLVLLGMSAAVVLVMFVLLHNPLPIAGEIYLPSNLLLAAFIFTTYTLFGWVGLTLIYVSIQNARALGALAQRPLAINVLDPTPLLPFGQLSLVHSISLVGIVLILLMTLGRPGHVFDYSVIMLASLAGLLTLVLPLWGVHSQIKEAKEDVLARLCDQLATVQCVLLDDQEIEADRLKELSDRADKLTNFRTLVLQSPSWPYRDIKAVTRALLTATSPLVYFALNEVVRTYFFPLISR